MPERFPGEVAAARRLEGRGLQRPVRRHVQRAAARRSCGGSAGTCSRSAGNDAIHEGPRLRQRLPLRPARTRCRARRSTRSRASCATGTPASAPTADPLRRRPPDGASMRLFNADGSRVGGVGQRRPRPGGTAAARRRAADARRSRFTPRAGVKRLTRTERDGSRQTFRAAMGLPGRPARRSDSTAAGETLQAVVMTFGNPQCVVLGPLPDDARFQRLGPGARASRDVSRRGPTSSSRRSRRPIGAHPDLGARRRADARRRAPDRARR